MTAFDPWVQTASGLPFDLLEPKLEAVRIGDVQRHLARIARYSGATCGPIGYTVAQHSIICADLVRIWGGDARLEREALLHDAAEAFYGDITQPVQLALARIHREQVRNAVGEVLLGFAYVEASGDDVAHRHDGLDVQNAVRAALDRVAERLENLDPLRELKRRVDVVVREALGLAVEEPALVKRADLVALAIERKLIMQPCERLWDLPELADTRWRSIDVMYAAAAEEAFVARLADLDLRISES